MISDKRTGWCLIQARWQMALQSPKQRCQISIVDYRRCVFMCTGLLVTAGGDHEKVRPRPAGCQHFTAGDVNGFIISTTFLCFITCCRMSVNEHICPVALTQISPDIMRGCRLPWWCWMRSNPPDQVRDRYFGLKTETKSRRSRPTSVLRSIEAEILTRRLIWLLPSGLNISVYFRLIELRFYVPLDTKWVISETFFPANLLAKYCRN